MSERKKLHPYVCLARKAVSCCLNGENLPSSGLEIDQDETLWSLKRACFVLIKTRRGDLRGCIGTILPSHSSLDKEIMANAISASTKDPRFKTMKPGELLEVLFSVDVLSLPEPVKDIADLDHAKWGVIVSKGLRRGVLLPDLEGVGSVQEQLEIAAQKVGIHDVSGATIERFTVNRYKEE